MQKVQIYFDEIQFYNIKTLAQKKSKPYSFLIRDAVTQYLHKDIIQNKKKKINWKEEATKYAIYDKDKHLSQKIDDILYT